MAKTDIWMPIYIGDYLGDTQHLSAEKHGIYLLLMMHYWIHGPLENDLEEISFVARSTEEKVKKILEKFFKLESGHWKHGRIEKEKAKASTRSESARSNAKKRWDNQKTCDGISDGNATEDAKSMLNGCSSSSPSSLSLSLPSTSTSNKTTKDIATKVADSAFEEFWQSYPKKVGKGQAQKTWDKLKIKVIDEILASLKWQRVCEQWQKDGGQFIPNPSTYLSQQRWLDEQPMPTKVIAYETPYQKSKRDWVAEMTGAKINDEPDIFDIAMQDAKRISR